MNNATLKKWLGLSALLGITLILVWKAPPSEQPVVVEAVKNTVPASTETRAAIEQASVAEAPVVALKQRLEAQPAVNLFDIPTKAMPARVINKPLPVPAEKRVQLPFRYIGKLEQKQRTTLFVMEGPALYLVEEGDVLNDRFRLQKVDKSRNELIWLYLPLNETRKMSMEK